MKAGKNIWKNNNQNFSKFDENYKPTNSSTRKIKLHQGTSYSKPMVKGTFFFKQSANMGIYHMIHAECRITKIRIITDSTLETIQLIR